MSSRQSDTEHCYYKRDSSNHSLTTEHQDPKRCSESCANGLIKSGERAPHLPRTDYFIYIQKWFERGTRVGLYTTTLIKLFSLVFQSGRKDKIKIRYETGVMGGGPITINLIQVRHHKAIYFPTLYEIYSPFLSLDFHKFIPMSGEKASQQLV